MPARQFRGPLRIQEEDNNPNGTPITLKFTNGSITDNGDGTFSIDVTAGGGTWGSITGTLSNQTDLQSALDAKQVILVSGTNIKTINSTSLLGAGDIAISASPGGANTQIQFNSAGAFGGDSGFTWNNTNKAAVLSSSQSTQDGLKVTNSHGSANQIFAVTGWGNRSNTYGGLMGYISSYAEWVGVYGKQGDGGAAILGEKTTSIGHSLYAYGNTFLNGSYDEIQLTVQGHSTQTSDIFVVEKSDGTDLFNVTNTGTATFAGNVTLPTLITTGNIELGNASDTTLSRSSAGVLAVEGVVIPSISSTNTLTNKFITPQVQSVADAGGTLTPVSITNDVVIATALSQATTIAAPTGSPVQGERLVIRLKDNGTARALTWNAIYRASSGLALPTTTTLSKTLYCGFIYNSTDTKWDLVAYLDNF